MKITVETITPSQAEAMLATNTANRKVDRPRVRLYAEQIKSGQWKLTGDAIRISSDNVLLDGQHRLHAIILSGLPVETVVARNVDPSTYTVIDTGKNRTVADVLTIAGVTGGTHLAPIARLFIGVSAGLVPTNTEAMRLVTRTDISEWVQANLAVAKEAVAIANRLYGQVGGNRSAWGAFYLLVGTVNGWGHAQQFCDTLVSGAGLQEGDARLALRNWATASRHRRTSNDGNVQLATYIGLYNRFLSGKTVTRVMPWTVGSAYPTVKKTTSGSFNRTITTTSES